MNNKDKQILKEKIKSAIRISAQKLIQKKKELGQELVVSDNGKIKTISPFDVKM
jgi:hypothetical protein